MARKQTCEWLKLKLKQVEATNALRAQELTALANERDRLAWRLKESASKYRIEKQKHGNGLSLVMGSETVTLAWLPSKDYHVTNKMLEAIIKKWTAIAPTPLPAIEIQKMEVREMG